MINNIFSSFIQTNYSEDYYNNIEINQYELDSLIDKFENKIVNSKFDNNNNMYFILIKEFFREKTLWVSLEMLSKFFVLLLAFSYLLYYYLLDSGLYLHHNLFYYY